MKKIIFSTMIASLLAFVGCQNEELVNENTNNGGEKVILTANIQGAADSRVVLTPDTDNEGNPIVKVAWNESGETFEVYGSSGASSTFTQIAGTNQFEGTLPESADGEYEAYYGNHNSLDEQQDGKLGQSTANDTPVLMSAMFDSSSPSITFEHVTAILKPTFMVDDTDIDNSITKIVMSNVAKPTPGDSDNAFNLETITITPTSSATVLDDNIYIHLIVFPQLYVEDYEFTFTVTDKDNKEYTGSLTIPTGMSIEAGKFYTATIELEEVKDLEYIATSNTFIVKTAAGLQHLNQWITDKMTTDELKALYPDCQGIPNNTNRYAQNITLAADITLPTVAEGVSNWTPIGTKNSPYTGIFEGNNKTIKNLIIYPGSSAYNQSNIYVGFIGFLKGHVRNLILEDVTIDACNSPGNISVGGIVAQMSEYAQVSGCTVSGNLNDGGRASYIAGIVGYNASQNTGASISGCVNTADISGGQFVGGIVGYSKYSTVMQCENSGKVEFKTSGRAGNVGGIAGKIDENAIISSCVNRGIVKSEGASLGGIVGFTQNGTLINCINMAPATATSPSLILSVNDGSSWLGGILGYSNGSTDKVIGCINHADMQYNYQRLRDTQDVNVGGIVGSTNGDSFVACGNTGNITIELVGSSSYHKLNVGGICGSNSDRKFYGCWTNIVVEHNNSKTEVALENRDGFGTLKSPESKSDYIIECYTAASKSDGETKEAFINGKVDDMNTALSSYGWQWVAGTNGGWPTLVKNN